MNLGNVLDRLSDTSLVRKITTFQVFTVLCEYARSTWFEHVCVSTRAKLSSERMEAGGKDLLIYPAAKLEAQEGESPAFHERKPVFNRCALRVNLDGNCPRCIVFQSRQAEYPSPGTL